MRRDFKDDFEDLIEDFKNKMPNPFILRLYNKNLINLSKNYSQKELEYLTLRSKSYSEQKNLIKNIISKLNHNLPKEYSWIKRCN